MVIIIQEVQPRTSGTSFLSQGSLKSGTNNFKGKSATPPKPRWYETLPFYWVGQKVHLGFSITSYGKKAIKLFGQPYWMLRNLPCWHLEVCDWPGLQPGGEGEILQARVGTGCYLRPPSRCLSLCTAAQLGSCSEWAGWTHPAGRQGVLGEGWLMAITWLDWDFPL